MSITKRKQKEWRDKIADQRTMERSNYPGAPSAAKGIIAVYRELIMKAVKNKKHFKALVLGATPEIRDLVLELGGSLVTLDVSTDMIVKCNKLMRYAGHKKEKIIIGDWLESGLADNSFDVVIGDGVTNNISVKDHSRFFKENHRLLKKDGYLIIREFVFNSKIAPDSVKKITQKFDRGVSHWFDMFLSLYINSELKPKIYNRKQCRLYMKKLFDHLYLYYKKGELSQKAFDAMWWFRSNIIHTFVEKEVLEKNMTDFFQLLPVKQADNFFFTKNYALFFFGQVKK